MAAKSIIGSKYGRAVVGLLCCFITGGFVVPARAQQPKSRIEQQIVDIDAVTVSARRDLRQTATTRTVLDSAMVAESVNLSFAELLTKHSPVFVKTYGLGSMATVSFRGTAASHTQVEWNGLNVNNPMLGQVDFSMIPVWMVDRAELLHGGSSMQQGSGALGGSVMLSSSPRWDKTIYGAVMQGVGSFGNYQTMVDIGGGNQKVQARARYIYQQARNDFEYLNTAIPPFEYMRQQHAEYCKHSATADVFWRVGKKHYLALSGWWTMADRNLPPIMSYEGRGRNEWQKDQDARGSLRWSYYGRNMRSELIVGYGYTTVNYFLANRTDLGEVVNYDSRSRTSSLQAKYRIDWDVSNKTKLSGLVNAAYHEVGTLDYQIHQGYTACRAEAGASLTVHQQLARRFSGYALLRAETNGAWMPSLGLEYEPIDNLRLRANGTRNYHQPTLNDLHWLPGGNPDLCPERGYTADLAAEYEPIKNVSFGVTGYMSWIDDWIMWRPSEFRYWTATNIRKVFARGVEVNLKAGHRFGPVDVSLGGNYAFTRTTNEEPDLADDASRGKQLIYIPVHKANVMLDVAYWGFYLNYTWSFTGERYTSSSNQQTRHSLPAYGLHNLAVGKTIWRFDIQFKIDNLFDKDYQAILWRAMPRRNYTLLVKFNIG